MLAAALAVGGLGPAARAQATVAAVSPAPAPPAPAATPAGPRTFVIDAGRSAFVVQTFKDGAASALAHDHTVRATELKGEVIFDPAAPQSARLNVTVQTRSLVVDEPEVRKRYALPPIVPERDRRTVDSEMKGPGQLDVARFPTMSFSTTGVDNPSQEAGALRLLVVGDLTIHGVAQRVRIPVSVVVADGLVTGTGKLKLKVSDYGIKPYSAYLGAVKVKDEVVLHVKLVAGVKT